MKSAGQTARDLTPAYACSKRERKKIEALFSELKLRVGIASRPFAAPECPRAVLPQPGPRSEAAS
jgi:hypothetical protein